jgi:hypothetical protein
MTATVTLLPHAAYVLVVAVAKTSFIVSSTDPDSGESRPPIRLARTADDATAPPETEPGHMLELGAGATRALFPTGAIWAKVIGGRPGYLAVDHD